eukprot:2689930-Pyramimonas_sp.AAC.1
MHTHTRHIGVGRGGGLGHRVGMGSPGGGGSEGSRAGPRGLPDGSRGLQDRLETAQLAPTIALQDAPRWRQQGL